MENIYLILFKNNVHTCNSHKCHKSHFYVINKIIYVLYRRRIRAEPYNSYPQYLISIATRLILKYNKYLIQLPVEQTDPEYHWVNRGSAVSIPCSLAPSTNWVNREFAVAHITFHISHFTFLHIIHN